MVERKEETAPEKEKESEEEFRDFRPESGGICRKGLPTIMTPFQLREKDPIAFNVSVTFTIIMILLILSKNIPTGAAQTNPHWVSRGDYDAYVRTAQARLAEAQHEVKKLRDYVLTLQAKIPSEENEARMVIAQKQVEESERKFKIAQAKLTDTLKAHAEMERKFEMAARMVKKEKAAKQNITALKEDLEKRLEEANAKVQAAQAAEQEVQDQAEKVKELQEQLVELKDIDKDVMRRWKQPYTSRHGSGHPKNAYLWTAYEASGIPSGNGRGCTKEDRCTFLPIHLYPTERMVGVSDLVLWDSTRQDQGAVKISIHRVVETHNVDCISFRAFAKEEFIGRTQMMESRDCLETMPVCSGLASEDCFDESWVERREECSVGYAQTCRIMCKPPALAQSQHEISVHHRWIITLQPPHIRAGEGNADQIRRWRVLVTPMCGNYTTFFKDSTTGQQFAVRGYRDACVVNGRVANLRDFGWVKSGTDAHIPSLIPNVSLPEVDVNDCIGGLWIKAAFSSIDTSPVTGSFDWTGDAIDIQTGDFHKITCFQGGGECVYGIKKGFSGRLATWLGGWFNEVEGAVESAEGWLMGGIRGAVGWIVGQAGDAIRAIGNGIAAAAKELFGDFVQDIWKPFISGTEKRISALMVAAFLIACVYFQPSVFTYNSFVILVAAYLIWILGGGLYD